MNIEELMIGDIVQYADGEECVVTNVRRIDGEDGIVSLKQANGHVFQTEIDRLAPVPLTFSTFVEYCKSLALGHAVPSLDVKTDGGHDFEIKAENALIKLNDCEYLHIMQHAFRLCGIEKKTNNSPVVE